MPFDHEKFDVYQLALEFVSRADKIVDQLPRGRGYLGDQLRRAASSIPLNIAEGAGRFSPADKAVFYTRARASVAECAAALDSCLKMNLVDGATVNETQAILERIGQMLTKLIKSRRPVN